MPEEPEASTRARRIDPKLQAAGWKVVRFQEGTPLSSYDRSAIAEYPTETGPTDYALCVGGRILGIVEAKKLTLGPQNAAVTITVKTYQDFPRIDVVHA
jgi:type I restriction enzyme, R subunit